MKQLGVPFNSTKVTEKVSRQDTSETPRTFTYDEHDFVSSTLENSSNLKSRSQRRDLLPNENQTQRRPSSRRHEIIKQKKLER